MGRGKGGRGILEEEESRGWKGDKQRQAAMG
jgi:hypothetical protein